VASPLGAGDLAIFPGRGSQVNSDRPYMYRLIKSISRILFAFAALWSIGAGLWIALTPLTVVSVTSSESITGESTFEHATRQVSWYSVQGLWGIIILLIFAGMYAGAAYFAWKSKKWPAGIISFLAVVLTILAGFSIGAYYLPAALSVLVGTILLLIPNPAPASDQSSE